MLTEGSLFRRIGKQLFAGVKTMRKDGPANALRLCPVICTLLLLAIVFEYFRGAIQGVYILERNNGCALFIHCPRGNAAFKLIRPVDKIPPSHFTEYPS